MSEFDVEELLRQMFPCWNELSDADRREVLSCSRLARFNADDVVQGAHRGCAGVVFVVSGGLRAYLLGESGREITLFRLKPKGCCVLAASCIMPMISVDITLAASSDSVVVVIDSSCFSRVAQRNVCVEAFMYRQATERISDVLRVMNRALFSDFNTRLAEFILEEVDDRGTRVLRMTHDEIARHVGSAREVVTRALRQLSDAGAVKLSRGVVEVVDRSYLQRVVEVI